jgi:1,6-anhydro-N-acetylmuramate kinase
MTTSPFERRERERLPDRRRSEIIDFQHAGRSWTAAVSRFGDGRIAEIFLNGGKDSAVAQLAQESAILASIAMQFGADIRTIRHAIESTGAGPLSAALGLIEEGAR